MNEKRIFAKVPSNTLPYRCGERIMACIIKGDPDTARNKGDISIIKCVEFFKSQAAAKECGTDHPDYMWKI